MKSSDWLLIKIAVITAMLCAFSIAGLHPIAALVIFYFATPLVDHCNKWWLDFWRG